MLILRFTITRISNIITRKMAKQSHEKSLIRIKPVVRSTPASLNISELSWPTISGGNDLESSIAATDQLRIDKSAVSELIGALKNAPSSSSNLETKLGHLKKHLSSANDRHPKPLHAPLHDRERERLERSVAYQQTTTDIGDWDEIVRNNRLADKLTFPIFTEPLKHYTIEEKIEQFEPRTRLEMATAEILSKSKHNLRNAEPMTEAEKEQLKSMSLEEAKERRSKLQKMRALVSYAERKLRWKNRIKSKRYRRILKTQERKKVEKEFQELLDRDPAAALEKLEMLERDRIKERASLKHRSTGKWAKQVRHLAKKDPRLREALQEQLRKGRELAEKKRQVVAVDDDEDEEEDADDDDDGQNNGTETAKDDVGDKAKRDKWTAAQPMLQVTPRLITNVTGEMDDETECQTSNQALMAEAFAEDDVMDEFRAELEADMDKEDEEAVANLESQLTLPGWNSWTGPGTENLKANKTRRDRLEKLKSKREKEKERKLAKWPMVKINEDSANESVRKLQVSDLPFPFQSTKDFEANLEPPLGKEWNPETAHQSLIDPSVETLMGAVIKPISRELALKKKTKGDQSKRRRRKRTKRKDGEEDQGNDGKKSEKEGKGETSDDQTKIKRTMSNRSASKVVSISI